MGGEHYLKQELYARFRADARLLDVLEQGSLDGIWYWDLERPSEEWMSPRLKGVLGYADEEVPNTAAWWQQAIFAEDLEVARANFEKHLADPSYPYDQIVRYRHKDSSTVWVRCRGIILRDDAGKPIRMLGAHTDVTALKRAEAALAALAAEREAHLTRELERRTAELRAEQRRAAELAAIVASADEATASMRRDGALRAGSPAAERLFGHRADAVVGELESFADISAHKAAERRLQESHGLLERMVEERTAALQRSNEDLEAFAYVASHDLQEPLRMVASFTELLAEEYGDKLDDEARKYIRFAVDGARRMQRLLNDLLAYARLGSGPGALTEVCLAKKLATALSNLKLAIDESGAVVTHDPLPMIQGSATQLIQLFQNLIANAIKFTAEGVRPRIHVACAREGDMLHLAVRDNGIGFDMKYADRIFGIFQRLSRGDARPGSGIGLAICKRVVERHGGQIWAESAEGQGTTMHFTLRAARPEA